jgi:hypothetical protein
VRDSIYLCNLVGGIWLLILKSARSGRLIRYLKMLSRRSILCILFSGLMLIPSMVVGQMRCGTEGAPADMPLERVLAPRAAYEMQIVVHIVYNDEEQNLSDAQVRSQIDLLNRDFNGMTDGRSRISNTFRDLVGVPGWRFCLATTDPVGLPTDGIVRVQTNETNIAHPGSLERGLRKIKHTNLGGSDAWDPDRYINVWVGNTGGDFVIGDATFPGTATEDEDGIMVDYRLFGGLGGVLHYYPFHLGKTLTHEMGHYFNLAHLSGNGGCDVDDGVEDTPQQGQEYFNCPSGPVGTCGSEDMVQNFMSLASDPCLLFFTKGQVDRMEQAVLAFRSGLIEPRRVCGDSIQQGTLESFSVIVSLGTHQLLIQSEEYLTDPVHARLIDLSGREIWKATMQDGYFFPFQIQDLPMGVYVLQLVYGEQSRSFKLVL